MNRSIIQTLALIFGLALSISGPAVADISPHNIYKPVPAQITATCSHYDNRARFLVRGERAAFVTVLADACHELINELYVRFDTTPFVKKRAELLLTRMAELKSTIITMNMERAFGTSYTPRTQLQVSFSNQGQIRQQQGRMVSTTGEYLIAREIGVLEAYHAWSRAADYETVALR